MAGLSTTKGPRRRAARIVGAQVLFMDVVGFTRRHSRVQITIAEALKAIVGKTPAGQKLGGAAHTKTRFIPTGDGMAIVFFNQRRPIAAEYAFRIAKALKAHNDLQPSNDKLPEAERKRFSLRMGIHKAEAFKYYDINGESNIAGDAINLAQRIMDCGNPDHILISDDVAKSFRSFFRGSFKSGEVKRHWDKHGNPLSVCPLYDDRFGEQIGPPSKGILSVIRTRDECYKAGLQIVNKVLGENGGDVYSMICFPNEYRRRKTPDIESEYRDAIHRVCNEPNCRLYRLINFSAGGIRGYVNSELINIISSSQRNVCVAETTCEFVDILIGVSHNGEREALITFPTSPKARRSSDGQKIHWGIMIKGNDDLVYDLRNWYEHRLRKTVDYHSNVAWIRRKLRMWKRNTHTDH